MKSRRKKLSFTAAMLSVIAAVLWFFSPVRPVLHLAQILRPSHLENLGPRGANPQFNKAIYLIWESGQKGCAPQRAIEIAVQLAVPTAGRQDLLTKGLVRNYKIAGELGLLTESNLRLLQQGRAPTVTKGPYAGESTEVDHIIPYSLAPELGNEFSNLELLPKTLNRKKLNKVGARQLDLARKFLDLGLLRKESWEKLNHAFRPGFVSSTLKGAATGETILPNTEPFLCCVVFCGTSQTSLPWRTEDAAGTL